MPTPDIKSTCGFCGTLLKSWPVRVDHLAEHFKQGSDMKHWKGDWGFDAAILSIVENAIPPCEYLSCVAAVYFPQVTEAARLEEASLTYFAIDMIHEERISPLPYTANQPFSQSSTQTPNGYELIKLELAYYLTSLTDSTGVKPRDDELQHEGCRIIFGSDVLSKNGTGRTTSWLRDLLMSSEDLKRRAQMGPIRGKTDSCLYELHVPGQDNIFEDCPLEKQLREFVRARTLLGMTATDEELQVEACNIIGRMEESSVLPSEDIANFLLRLILGNSTWLSSFRERADLPPTERSLELKGKGAAESSIYSFSQLENELAEFVQEHRATMSIDPSDADLRKHARRVVHKCQDSWKETAADNADWLGAFKQRQNFQQQHSMQRLSNPNDDFSFLNDNSLLPVVGMDDQMAGFGKATSPVDTTISPTLFTSTNSPIPMSRGLFSDRMFLMNGSTCYRRLARELGRFVTKSMSPNNPNRHIPTDDELQYQARWILYDE